MSRPALPVDPRALALAAASDPAPASVERGPVARLHWRHGLDVDPDLAGVVVDTPAAPGAWSALLAETHAALLDPDGCSPLARPSPIASRVVDALRAAPAWPSLADAAQSHPMIAREAVTSLASTVLDALQRAGATPQTDALRSLADLDAARAALERARAAARTATTSTEKRDALRKTVDAQAAEERARAAVAVDQGIAQRAGDTLEAASAAVGAVASAAVQRAEGLAAWSAGCGSGAGVGGSLPVSDDVLRALTPHVAAMLRAVGALRAAIREGRSARHVRGREGMVGVTQGGIAHAADLTPLALAGLAGHLGAGYGALVRLALVESRADVVEKGGGTAHRGDVVLAVDQSGSTQGARQIWIGALALAVLLEARAENRRAALVTFSDGVDASIVVDSPASLARAVVVLSRPTYGGTNVRAALAEASAVLGRMPHGGDPADALLITDGEWRSSDAAGWTADRARLRAAFVGGSAPMGAAFASSWTVRAVDGAEGAAVAVEIARTVV